MGRRWPNAPSNRPSGSGWFAAGFILYVMPRTMSTAVES